MSYIALAGRLSTGSLESESLPVGTSSEDLGQLLEEFRPYLLAIAKAELPQALAAKMGASDLIQLTLADGHFKYADFRGQSREELARWLRQILQDHLKSAVRAYSRRKRDISREVGADSGLVYRRQLSPSGEALSSEERALLERALERLPDAYRQVIELRHRDNLSFRDLGGRLHRSEEAARKLWTRAVQKLQQELGIDASRRVPVRREPT